MKNLIMSSTLNWKLFFVSAVFVFSFCQTNRAFAQTNGANTQQTLSDNNDIWNVSDNDRTLDYIDALEGTDTVVFGDGNHSAANISTDGLYRNFEQANLSDNNNIWTVSGNDRILDYIDALEGTDTVVFGDGNHSAANISADGLYRNFEQANLSDNNNIWTVSGNDRTLDYIDALEGTDTVVFGDGNHNAANISADGLYRNFEQANLSDNDNIWTVSGNDGNLASIDAMGGNDTLEDSITDAQGDGFFNSADSSFSESNLGNGQYANYSNFELVAVELTADDDVWSVSADDFNKGWQWINAQNGSDTVAFGDGNHNATDMGDDGFYRNFEHATLSDNDNIWTVSDNDGNLSSIDAMGGNDTVAFGDGNHNATDIRADGLYRNFERATLSDNTNIWTVSDNDGNLSSIDASGGTDTIAFGDGSHNSTDIRADGLYRNFERAILSNNGNIWTVSDNDGDLLSINALGGTDVLEDSITDAQGDGFFNSTDSLFSESSLGSGRYANYSNFELVAIGLTANDDVWSVSDERTNKEWRWINAREGIDTVVLGDGNHSAANISADGFYRNFERVILSDNDNTWTVTDNDGNLLSVDASGGTDTIVFGDGNHSAADTRADGLYRNFERANLSDNDNIWTVTDNDGNLTSIDAMGGNDTLEDSITDVEGDGFFNSADSSFSESSLGSGRYANYSSFELAAVGLTANDDVWSVSGDDFNKGWQWINAKEGTDTIAFGDGNHSAANISADGFYRNFERATLSDNDNTWTVTDNDGNLLSVNASGGTDTIAFGDGNHSAADISADGLYRNFERATLSDNENTWTISDNDANLSSIDAMGGTDMLEESITDVEGDGFFNSSDSSFSESSLGSGQYAKYLNFELVSIGLTADDDVWSVSGDDFNKGWQWINAKEGTDTVAFGDGNHSAANISADGFYRNFERATLSDNDNTWTVTDNDDGLSYVDASEGTDTIAFGDGNHSAANISSDGLYRNFERATLSDNDNTWTVTDNDDDLLSINASGGIDTIALEVEEDSETTFDGDSFSPNTDARYKNFESIRKTGEGTLLIENRLDLGSGGEVSVEEGTLLFNIVFAREDDSESVNASGSAKIVADSIRAENGASIAVSENFDIIDLSKIQNGSLAVFEGNAAGVGENVLVDPGLFADLSANPAVCPEGICLTLDSESGAQSEINSFFNSANPREILRTVHSSLLSGKTDEEKSEIVNTLNTLNPQTEDQRQMDEETVRNLVPSEHGGISHEIINVQRTFFEFIEEKAVEAVAYKPWDEVSKPGKYRVFAGGFEKTTSADLYDIGSRGFSAGVHRLIFDGRVGVGIAAATSSMETRRERVNEETEGFFGAVYAKLESERFSASAIGSLGTHEYKSARSSSFGNINGETDIKVYGTKISAGLELLKNSPVRITPGASLMLVKASTDSYSENGGLDIALKDDSTTSSEAGAKVSVAFNSLKTVLQTVVQPEIEAGIYYDFSAASNDNLNASIFDTDYRIFRPQTTDNLRYVVGGHLVLSDNKHLAFKIGYKAGFSKDLSSHSGTGQFHIRF